MMMEKEEGGVVVMGRVEIDTRPPFRSVREAVLLFGERVLAGEVIANKLKEMRPVNETAGEASRSQMAELEEAKKSLKRVGEENMTLARRIESLRLELEEARRELNRLKQSRSHDFKNQALLKPEIEDVKFVENLIRIDVMKEWMEEEEEEAEDEAEGFMFHREKSKRIVKFASPPSLTRVMVAKEEDQERNKDDNNVLERPSLKKKKSGNKKPLVGLMGWFLFKKKADREDESPR